MIELHTLRPFQSYVFLRVEDRGVDVLVNPLLRASIDFLQEDGLVLADLRQAQESDDVPVSAAIFEEHRTPSWSMAPEPHDTTNHLLLYLQLGSVIALHMSDGGWRTSLFRHIRAARDGAFGHVLPIEPGIMNAAFGIGRARTLWLAGTHPRSAIKSDSKIVSGQDLRSALDPLGDQTYHFTAARCEPGIFSFPTTVGYSPYQSSAWVTKSADWNEFMDRTGEILLHLESTTVPVDAPIPILSTPLTHSDDIFQAFDVSLIPPELFDDDGSRDPDVRASHDLWAFGSSFEVSPADGPNLTTLVYLHGTLIGEIALTFDVSDPTNVLCHAYGEPSTERLRDRLDEACRLAENRKWLMVRYESGHTLFGRTLFQTRFRDVTFENVKWLDFQGYIITKEKPTPLDQIGRQDSLFCWLWNHWPFETESGARGWIACDDAANEMADFIHLDSTTRTVTLVHVKASGNQSSSRQLSVSKFEVVVSQAIKNLRFLDRTLLEQGLADGIDRQVGRLVLCDGIEATRQEMLAVFSEFGTSFHRQVVIVQPHLREDHWERAQDNPDSPEGRRLRQLNTILVEAEGACKALNARLLVIGEANH